MLSSRTIHDYPLHITHHFTDPLGQSPDRGQIAFLNPPHFPFLRLHPNPASTHDSQSRCLACPGPSAFAGASGGGGKR